MTGISPDVMRPGETCEHLGNIFHNSDLDTGLCPNKFGTWGPDDYLYCNDGGQYCGTKDYSEDLLVYPVICYYHLGTY